MNSIIEALQRRYATKKFDTTKKLSQEDMDTLLEALRLSPSSFGLQPWKFIQVTNPEIRKELQANSRGQPQITEASDLIIIAVKTNIQETDVEEFIQDIIDTRKLGDASALAEYKGMMIGTIEWRTEEQLKGWAQKQAYIAMGVLLTVCASLWIDACPMEGFDAKKYDEILGLDKLWLTATLVIPVGYRSTEDSSAQFAKVRFQKEKMIMKI
ncbi:MAG: nitroreductase [uncultured bacterium (gcode 4)]|uniref:Nitroreductase n=1 Tax=uncultured bacterium (gcode 4) TaxID=1234023 RepID=K1XJB6_9BACT|nr:MAG: nitroreductase [uncultured bacterium (gcode 4)]